MRTKLLLAFILLMGMSNFSFGQNCISDISIEQDDCTPFGTYTAFVSFEHSPNVDSVSLFFDGEFFGNHPAAFQPIVLAGLGFNPNGNNFHSLRLQSTVSSTCSDTTSFEAVCVFGSEDCLSEIFFADAFCIDDELQFEVGYTFLNPVSEGHIYVNGEFIANATVGENQSLSFSIENTNPQSVYEIVVRDAEFLSCGDTLITQVTPCIENCTSEFDISTTCNSDGTFNLALFHSDSVMTKVYLNNQFISQIIPGQSSPFLIDDIQLDPAQMFQTITTCLVSSPTCCRTLTFEQPACEPCDINLSLNEVFCEGFAPVFDISYDYENPASSAQLFVNGSFIQDVSAGLNTNLFLNPQITNDQGTYIITLQDSLLRTCGDTLIINNFFCDECIVETSNLQTECIPGTDNYQVDIDIFNSGTTPVFEYFIIHQTGETFGPFSPQGTNGIVQASFEVPTSLQGQFQVFDADGICNAFFNTQVDCNPNTDCAITNVLLDHECIDESSFVAFIGFEHSNLVGNEVEILDLSGQSLGFFDVNQQPFTIPVGLSNPGINAFGITILNPLDSNCIAQSNVIGVDCGVTDTCEVAFIEVLNTECNPDGTYNISVNYNINIQSASEILVNVNGVNYDVVPNPNLVFTVEGITPRSNSDFGIITICSAEFPTCCNEIEFFEPNCSTNQECTIRDIEYEAICLDSAGLFMIDLFYSHMNTSGEVVVTNFAGANLGQFDVNQQPIRLGPFTQDDLDDEGIGFVVCDSQMDGCCAEVFATNIPCEPDFELCVIEFIEIISRECNPDGTYNLTATYDITNGNNDFIDVSVNGGSVQSFTNSGSLVVTNITPRPNSDFDIIEICLNDNIDCCQVNEYPQPICDGDEECTIMGLEYEAICLDSAGLFMINLFYSHMNTSGEVVVTNFAGANLGQFDVNQQPIILGPFTQDDLDDEGIGFVVCDSQMDGCCAEVFATNIPCEPNVELCAIEFIEIISTNCTSDSTYSLNATYSISNGDNDFIDVTINGGPLQSFTNSGSLVVTNIVPRPNSDFDIIEICLNDNPDCCQVLEFAQPTCTTTPQECEIEIVDVDFFCDSTGDDEQIFFQLDVESNNMNDFLVFVNGESIGTGTVSDMITLVGPFEQNDDGFYNIEVIDANDSSCRSEFELNQAFCPDECFIGELDVVIECLDNGFFAAIITFPYDADHQDGVTIRGNGTNYGTFDGFSQPIILDTLLASANSDWEFIVIDNQDDSCGSEIGIGEIDCGVDEVACIIEDVEVFNLECIGENEYSMSVSFETGDNGNVPFSFFINGSPMNTTTTSSLPLNIFGVVPNDTSNIDVITICLDDLDEQCCVDFAYEQPACLFNSVVDETLLDAVTISPNPTSEMLYINDIPNDIVGLHIVDNLGRTVQQLPAQHDLNIDVTNYIEGLYTIQFFTDDNRVMSRRFIKM